MRNGISTITRGRNVCGGGPGHSPGRAKQPIDCQCDVTRSELHLCVELCLLGIGDEDILSALYTAGIEWIGPLLILETLDATNGEGGEDQNKCLEGGGHGMVGVCGDARATRLVFREVVRWALSW